MGPPTKAEALKKLETYNIDAWYAAFDVKPGDKLYVPPEARVRIW